MIAFMYIAVVLGWWTGSLVFFLAVQKPLFYLLNRRKCPHKPGWRDVAAVYRHGLRSDAIVATYLTAIPMLLGLVFFIAPADAVFCVLAWVFTIYCLLAAFAVSLISLGDAGVYGYWDAKIDASVFPYLRHPKGAFASVSTAYIIAAVVASLILAVVYGATLLATSYVSLLAMSGLILFFDLDEMFSVPYTIQLVVCVVAFLAMGTVAFIIIRGLRIRPNNPSIAYYSPCQFFNHWALNPAYNMIYSLGTRNEFAGKFASMPAAEATATLQPLYPVEGTPERRLLNTTRPNILTIVWESFGADYCGVLGGKAGVTPCFDAEAARGVLCSRVRASSFRTDRALPAIFCGLPGQPDTSVVRHTRKLPGLPAWPRDLAAAGYSTVAIHGGDLAIMHKSDFYLSSGHSRLVSEKDFARGLDRGKWGVHDGPVLESLPQWLPAEQPWAVSVQTLSSHEPFTVPYARLHDKADNAMAYTDQALGALLGQLRRSPLWHNLLVIVVADHGLNLSDSHPDRQAYSHIPMLWTGGAVAAPAVVDTMMCQTDLAATLLAQLDMPHAHYPFSRDVLADTYVQPCAVHTWVNGFLFEDSTGCTIYDNIAQAPIDNTGDAVREHRGKAFLQALYSYIDKL